MSRGRKLNMELSSYLHSGGVKGKKRRKKRMKRIRNKHSRDLSSEQLGFGPLDALSPHSQHSQHSNEHSNHSKSRTHRKQKSNAEQAAKKLRKEIAAKSKQFAAQQQFHSNAAKISNIRHAVSAMRANDVSDDELSDDYYHQMSNKFNDSASPMYQMSAKRMSRSQPTSPRRFENEFNFDGQQRQRQLKHGIHRQSKHQTAHSNEHELISPGKPLSLQSARSQMVKPSAFRFQRPLQRKNNRNGAQEASLKPTSIWRKNGRAFLQQMDKKLEEVMNKFETKGTAATATATRPFNKPLTRTRGKSYHQATNEMQQAIQHSKQHQHHHHHMQQMSTMQGLKEKNNSSTRHKSSYSTTFDKFSWLSNRNKNKTNLNSNNITKTTSFSKYSDAMSGSGSGSNSNAAQYEIDSVFTKQPSFGLVPRRSISLPSSPSQMKQNAAAAALAAMNSESAQFDALDLDEDHASAADTEQDDVSASHSHGDVEHDLHPRHDAISDESSISEQDEDDLNDLNDEHDDDLLPDEENLFVARKQSQKVTYDRSIRRRRLRRGLKPVKPRSPQLYGDDMDDMHDMQIPDALHTLHTEEESKSASIASIDEQHEEEEQDEDEDEQPYYRRTRSTRNKRRRRYQYKNDTDSDSQQMNEISDSDDVHDVDDDGNQQDDDLIDFDEDEYNSYQAKKRDSKTHLLGTDEFEKEFNKHADSLLQ